MRSVAPASKQSQAKQNTQMSGRLHYGRHGKRISRTFAEARWGGREAAIAMAQDWRDAVMAAIPPISNQHAATRIGTRNTTGISGVCYYQPNDNPDAAMWVATLTNGDEQKKRAFSISTYGEDVARAHVIAQRQKWLAQLPPRYHTMCDASRAILADQSPPESAQSLDPTPLMTAEQIDARVVTINIHFDALVPHCLRWRVRAQNAARPNGPIVVALSDTGIPVRKHVRTISPKNRPLSAVLNEATDWLRNKATELHGKDIADWFIQTHIENALRIEAFDPTTGYNGCVMVPKKCVSQADYKR